MTNVIKPNDTYELNKSEIARFIREFKSSNEYRLMQQGEKYFKGEHDIIHKHRTVIGDDGTLVEVTGLPNNRIVDNQYRKMVIQKNNYMLGKPISFSTESTEYGEKLNKILSKRFMRVLKNVGEDTLNCGIGYIYVGYDNNSKLKFTRVKPYEIVPIWEDAEHERLTSAIRIYKIQRKATYSNKTDTIEKVEVYTGSGIDYYEFISGNLKAVEPYHKNYFKNGDDELNWGNIPIIPFKYNNAEIPLIKLAKSLQDGINTIISNFQNNMEEDPRNTIMVLVNYDGENLNDFRKNLNTYGAIKIRTVDGSPGDVRTLNIEVNSENYKVILELFKKALIENCMGYDAKDDRLSGNANMLNIQSMYSDVDLDANGMETEYQASFEELLQFVNIHLYNTGEGDYEDEQVEVIFNRDMLINESEIIENINKSVGLLSNQTLVEEHPYVRDPQAELDRLANEKTDEGNPYDETYKK